MKMYKVSELKPGMRVMAPVLTRQNQILAIPGEEIDRKLISRMEFYGITEIQAEDSTVEAAQAVSPAVPPAPAPAPVQEPKVAPPPQAPAPEPKVDTMAAAHGYSTKVRLSENFQQYTIKNARGIGVLQNQIEAFLKNRTPFNTEELLNMTRSLIRPGQTVIEYFDMMHNMRSNDDSIYSHSLNVAMIANILGKWLKLSHQDRDILVIAGLLHDIGKAKIPPEILNKKEKLTDEEFNILRSHAKLGYDCIKDEPYLDGRVKKAALMHHERCDGSGYPMGLNEMLIDDFAMIIAIADVYDAMTATRKHRTAMCPFQVISEFESDGMHKFKPEYILTFLRKIAATYQNNQVVLSDGRSGKIILLNQNQLSKPLVQLSDGSCIDLARSSLYIQSIV